VRFPYVPGLLSFREAPGLLAVLRRLRRVPDVLLCDGHGRAHPRRFGLACHVGLLAGLPSVGCAKSLLAGRHGRLGERRGSRSPLRETTLQREEIIGTALRTRDGVRPVYVSVGHRIDLASAEALVLECAVGFRIPEPTRRADHLVARACRDWATRSR
jgi:deoxyribonuclease V